MARFWYLTALALMALFLTSGCSLPSKRKRDADVHYTLGLSYLREKDATRALKEFMLAEEYDSGNAAIQNALGQTYQMKRAFSESEAHYLRALRLGDQAPEYQNNLAALYLDMERWDDAIRYFRKAADNLLFATPEVAFTGMGYAYYQKREYLAAASSYGEALKHNPRYAPAHLRLGEAYYALDKVEKAISAYEQALEYAPDFALAHFDLGLAYSRSKQPAKAVASFKEVQRLAPDTELARAAGEYIKTLR